jgi:hypothetical protein
VTSRSFCKEPCGQIANERKKTYPIKDAPSACTGRERTERWYEWERGGRQGERVERVGAAGDGARGSKEGHERTVRTGSLPFFLLSNEGQRVDVLDGEAGLDGRGVPTAEAAPLKEVERDMRLVGEGGGGIGSTGRLNL